MIIWPAVIHYEGEDELIFIRSQTEWDSDPDLYSYPYSVDDKIIDNNGCVYSLLYDNEKKTVEIKVSDKFITVEEFEILIKKHMACLNQCCISKLHVPSFENGMMLVYKMNE